MNTGWESAARPWWALTGAANAMATSATLASSVINKEFFGISDLLFAMLRSAGALEIRPVGVAAYVRFSRPAHSRTTASANVGVAPWTPCGNGSMFAAAR